MKALYFLTLVKFQCSALEKCRDPIMKKERSKVIQHLNYAAYCAIAMQLANRYAWLISVHIGMSNTSPLLVRTHACCMTVAYFLNRCNVDKAELFIETNLNSFQKVASLSHSVPNFNQAQCRNEFKSKVFKYLSDARTQVYPQYNNEKVWTSRDSLDV